MAAEDARNAVVPAATSRWYALMILTAIFAIHYVDRGVIAVVIEPVKREFTLSDTAIGVLASFAHSAALAVAVIPAGLLADRVNRVRFISFLVVLWSVLTALGGLATSYFWLLLTRVGVGAAEAGGPPASVSLLSDIFPRSQLPTAMGILYTAAAIGTMIVYVCGGYLAHGYGWRAVFFLAGVPGVLLGLTLILSVREPVRGDARKGVERPSPRVMARKLAENATLRWIVAGGTAASVAQAALWIWLGSFLIRERQFALPEAGLVVGLCAGLGMGVGSFAAGPLSRLVARDDARALWRWPGAMLVLSVPAAWTMVLVQDTTATVAAAALLSVILGAWPGQAVGILAVGVPATMRATGTSVYQFCTNMFGVGFGPIMTGLISDLAGSLGHAIAATLSINILAAFCFARAARSLPASEAPVAA